MLCAQCSASLPDVARFCSRCGARVGADAALPQTVVHCAGCGAALQSGSKYCLECGRASGPAVVVPESGNPDAVARPPIYALRQARPSRRSGRWFLSLLAVLLLGGFIWMTTSDSTVAQSMQEYIGWKHDESVFDGIFAIKAGAVQVYTVTLPEGSVGSLLLGQFSSQSAVLGSKEHPLDSDIEVFVMTDAAFTNWQSDYSVTSLYESGKAQNGEIRAELPAAGAVYHVVFSNRSDAKVGRTVQASVWIRYGSWLPQSLWRIKSRILSWFD